VLSNASAVLARADFFERFENYLAPAPKERKHFHAKKILGSESLAAMK